MNSSEKPLVTLKKLSSALQIKGWLPAERTLRRYVAEQKIPFYKFGGRLLFNVQEVRQQIESQGFRPHA